MRYALISDIHANLPALKAVLADIDARSDIDAVYHLGDLVGYAPWPNEVVARLRVVDDVRYVNTGSVGRPKDGDARAVYDMIDIDASASSVAFIRVDYDRAAATAAIRASTLPDEFAVILETGGVLPAEAVRAAERG